MDLSKIAKVLGVFTASAAAASIVWAALDYTEIRPVTKHELLAVQRLAQDATRLALAARFQVLYDKVSKVGWQGLTFEEQQEYCRLAHELNYVGIQGCT